MTEARVVARMCWLSEVNVGVVRIAGSAILASWSLTGARGARGFSCDSQKTPRKWNFFKALREGSLNQPGVALRPESKQSGVMSKKKIVGMGLGVCLLAAGLGSTHAFAAIDRDKPAVPAVEPTAKTTVAAVTKKPVRKKTKAKKTVAKAKPAPMPLAIVSKPANNAPDYDFQDRIEEAQALAAKQPVQQGDMQFDGAGNLSRFTWVLIVGQKTGPLTVLRMDEKGRNDQGFTVTWPIDNFINTKFHVEKPEGYIVFAQRRPVRAPSYDSASATNGYQMGVYTSYAPEMDTKTMRAAGMEYLRHLQRLAYMRIKDHDVRSLVNSDTTVADRIPTSMVVRLMITEHIDPLHMKYVGIEQCIHEVLLTIAANKSRAYAYAKSSAGARGLSQFIESSYQMVRNNYPKALLEPNFERGMGDLRNAVLASILHLDLELTHLPPHYLDRITDSSQELAAFLAAGYNRNPVRVVKTYHKTRTFTGGNAPFETKMYVRIQSWVGSFLKKEYDVS